MLRCPLDPSLNVLPRYASVVLSQAPCIWAFLRGFQSRRFVRGYMHVTQLLRLISYWQ